MNRKFLPRPGSIRTLLFSGLLAALCLSAQSKGPPKDAPIGRWIAEYPSKGGVCSWWDFRADGTLTMRVGNAITAPIKRSGSDTFIAPAPAADDPPVQVTFHVEGDTLRLKSANVPEQTLVRVGPAPSATDPLLGRWKPVPPANLSSDIDVADRQKAFAKALFIFSPDNTESVRAPFTSYEGKWDASTHTFHLENQNSAFTYQKTGNKLTLSLPPDGKRTDTFVPDPIL
jgi:hypothetical protein